MGQHSTATARELNEKVPAYWAKTLGMPTNEEMIVQLQESGKYKKEDELGIKSGPLQNIETEAFIRDEVISVAKQSLNFLAGLAMPTAFKFDFPSTHNTAWQILTLGEQKLLDSAALSNQDFLQIALGIPRAHAKTTLIKLFILWCILFSGRKFILITAATEARAMDILSDVADMLNEDNITAVFGDWKQSIEKDTGQLKKFGYRGRNITLAAIGAEGSVRGLNIKNERPDVMIFDDIQTKECADSAQQSKTLLEWMVGTAMKAKSPSGCLFIFAGNMFSTPHSILRKLKTNPTWIKFISGAILVDGTALWPELRSLESLIDELNNDIAMGQAHVFFSEVLNDVEAGTNSNVDYSKFPAWPWSDFDIPQGKFVYIDPSQGKGKDFDVIMRVEVYDQTPGIKNIIEDHFSPGNLIRAALVEAISNDVYCIACEANGYQATLLYWFEQVCQDIGITGIQFVPIYQTQYSKNSRITSAIKAMQTKELYLHDSIKSLVQRQIADWNPMKRDNVDDILDAVSNAQKVVAEYPFEIMCKTNFLVLEAGASDTVQENNSPF